uniref:Secreted protein n=1 Tax=Dunaliella tertiolecta TaxID=3047 RepID=A0A7S3R345_DUNTE
MHHLHLLMLCMCVQGKEEAEQEKQSPPMITTTRSSLPLSALQLTPSRIKHAVFVAAGVRVRRARLHGRSTLWEQIQLQHLAILQLKRSVFEYTGCIPRGPWRRPHLRTPGKMPGGKHNVRITRLACLISN